MFCFPTRWRTEVTFLKIKDGVKMKFHAWLKIFQVLFAQKFV
jgi:hypothetical protein